MGLASRSFPVFVLISVANIPRICPRVIKILGKGESSLIPESLCIPPSLCTVRKFVLHSIFPASWPTLDLPFFKQDLIWSPLQQRQPTHPTEVNRINLFGNQHGESAVSQLFFSTYITPLINSSPGNYKFKTWILDLLLW